MSTGEESIWVKFVNIENEDIALKKSSRPWTCEKITSINPRKSKADLTEPLSEELRSFLSYIEESERGLSAPVVRLQIEKTAFSQEKFFGNLR